jgi:hypothetical protein
MKKTLPLIAVLLLTGSAWALTDISLGVYGGLNAPLAQEDAKSGTGFGLRLKVAPVPMFAGAAFFESRSFGDPEVTVFAGTPLEQTTTNDGGKVTVFGAEALLGSPGGGFGPHFYFMAGIANYKWKRDNFEDLSKVGYHIGPGLEVIFPPGIGLEGKAKFEIVPTDGGGSRKNLLLFVGANYHLGIM